MNEMIWTHEGKDYIAKPLTENDWKMMSKIVMARLLGDCKDIEDRQYRRERAEEIQSKDYQPLEILFMTRRDDILTELTHYPFKDNKGMTKELAMSFWNDEGFGKKDINERGFFDNLLEASGIPIPSIEKLVDDKNKEVEDANPSLAEAPAEPPSTQK